MLGAIVGDIIGSPYEHNNIKHTEFPLFGRHSRFTDDTVLTVAVADVLLNGGNYHDVLQNYTRRYADAGFGGRFWTWALEMDSEPLGSFGNGSAMRVSPVAWAFDDEDSVLAEAERSALPSHGHPEAIQGAQAVALAVFLARTGSSKALIRNEISQRFDYDLSRHLDDIRPTYGFDVSCRGSVPQALMAFLGSESYEDAVRKAVSLGGDSDTIACMAGSVAEAYYGGVPEPLQEQALALLDPSLRGVLEKFLERMVLPRMRA